MKKYIACCALFLISGCARVKITREFSDLKKTAHERTGIDISWQRHEKNQKKIQDEIKQQLATGISRDKAIGLALKNNADLQAAFEDLGIVKADLVQAGLYTNPHVESVFRFSRKKTNIETNSAIQLADLWQVPIRKKVAKDALEITTFSILRSIIDTKAQAKMAYNACLYAHALLDATKEIAAKVKELRDRIYYRQLFGYTSDYDKYFADIMVGQWKLNVVEHQMAVNKAYIHLKRTLGIAISSEPIYLTDQLSYEPIALAPLSVLEIFTLDNRPEIIIARMRIRQAEHALSLEKANIFDDVSFGVSFERDFDNTKGVGPLFDISIPLFDPNQAQIARARFIIQKTRKELTVEKEVAQEEVQHSYIQLQALEEKVAVYKQDIIPASKQAIMYAEKYFNAMQLNMVVLLETQITLYEKKKALIGVYYDIEQTIAKLERTVGRKIDLEAV